MQVVWWCRLCDGSGDERMQVVRGCRVRCEGAVWPDACNCDDAGSVMRQAV